MADFKVCLKVIDPYTKRIHVGVIFFKIAICFVVVVSFVRKIFTNKKTRQPRSPLYGASTLSWEEYFEIYSACEPTIPCVLGMY